MHPVRQRREELGLSIEEAAVKSGLSYSFWIKIERGERFPSFKSASRMAPVLGWTIAQLYQALDSTQGAMVRRSSA